MKEDEMNAHLKMKILTKPLATALTNGNANAMQCGLSKGRYNSIEGKIRDGW